MRTLVETGALVGERGAYRLTRPVETLQVPATVQTILAARIDRLPPEEKQLLQAASVIGKDVPYALLAAIAEQPDETLRRGLAHLQEAEFLYETQLFPDLEYTFKHALTHEVTYGSLLQDRRRKLHAQIVSAIERLYADRLSEQVERLAHHALRGAAVGEGGRAIAGRRGPGRSTARPPGRPSPTSSRRGPRCGSCPRAGSGPSSASTCASSSGTPSCRSASSRGWARSWTRGARWRRGSGTSGGSGWALGYLSVRHNFLGEHARAIEAGQSRVRHRRNGRRPRAAHRRELSIWLRRSGSRATRARRPIALRAVIVLAKEAPLGERFGMAGTAGGACPPVPGGGAGRPGRVRGGPRRRGRGPAHRPERRPSLQRGLRPLGPRVRASASRGLRGRNPRARARPCALPRDGDSLRAAVRRGVPGLCLSLGLGARPTRCRCWRRRSKRSRRCGCWACVRCSSRSWPRPISSLGRVAEAREQAEQAVALARAHQERGWEAWSLKLLGDVHAHAPA